MSRKIHFAELLWYSSYNVNKWEAQCPLFPFIDPGNTRDESSKYKYDTLHAVYVGNQSSDCIEESDDRRQAFPLIARRYGWMRAPFASWRPGLRSSSSLGPVRSRHLLCFCWRGAMVASRSETRGT
jgi:hypothetical protein